jgi:hypothetical protein
MRSRVYPPLLEFAEDTERSEARQGQLFGCTGAQGMDLVMKIAQSVCPFRSGTAH